MVKIKNKKNDYKPLINRLVDSLLNNDYEGCESVINDALRMQFQPGEIYAHILSASMRKIGTLWHDG